MSAENPRGKYEEKQNIEMALAQMETRLRSMISELLQPTIQRTALIVADVDSLKNLASQHVRSLQEVQVGQFKAMEQVSTIASFKEEMGRWDAQRRTHEAGIDEKVEVMQQKLEAYRYSLEQKESALHHLHRSVDRMAMEMNHTIEEQETQKECFDTRYDELSRKMAHSAVEIDVRIAGLELKHNSLTDELWGEETGLAKVAGELKKTNAMFETLENTVAELQTGKAEAAQLEKLRAEVARTVHEANTSVTDMRQTVGNVVNDVREHFRTAAQTISAHNATFISEVRESYKAELQSAANLRQEVQEFVGDVTKSIAGLDARVEEAASRASALAAEAREEVEELNKRRKRDKTSSENELKALKKRLGGVFDNSDQVLRGIEHIYGVLQTMLESELLQSSVELQDSVDRKRIALMGVKDDETVLARTTQSEPQRPRPECRAKSASAAQSGKEAATGGSGQLRGGPGTASARNHQEPVVRVDNRCLGCSGQAPLVLSAFKMACLQYAPSPVEYGGKHHDRSDLIQRRCAMLHTAHDALLEGPSGAGVGNAPKAMGPDAAAAAAEGFGGGDGMFADYAAIEAHHPSGQRGSGRAGGDLRLPNLSAAGASPRAITVR